MSENPRNWKCRNAVEKINLVGEEKVTDFREIRIGEDESDVVLDQGKKTGEGRKRSKEPGYKFILKKGKNREKEKK